MKQGPLHSWFALVLLLFASIDLCADLVSPRSCCEWIDNLAIANVTQTGPPVHATLNETILAAATDAHPAPSSNSPETDEDCFCCCAHILPGGYFNVAISNTESPAPVLTNALLPVPPAQSPFHPPRMS
jgi:hypothetical protein